jgi:hypothetical protein
LLIETGTPCRPEPRVRRSQIEHLVQEGDAADAGNEAGVKEQSHKNEMRAALRGDFDRMRARHEDGGEAECRPPPPTDVVAESPVAVQDERPSRLARWRARR